jgi:carbonic anhydrase
MSIIDNAVKANRDYARKHDPKLAMVRSHPWIAKEIPVRGFVFDMATGLLSEVKTLSLQTAA